MLILSLFIVSLKHKSLLEQEEEKTASLATIYANRFASELKNIEQESNLLRDTIVLEKGNITEEQYPTLASLIYKKEYYNVAFLPNGIVSYAYPEQENKKSIGHNVLTDENTKVDAIKAKESKENIFSGPYILKQGIYAIIARNPVYYIENNEEKFWGFVAIAIDPNIIIQQTNVADLIDFNYEICIKSTYKNEVKEFYKSTNFNAEKALSGHTIAIGQGRWNFSLYNNEQNTNIKKFTALLLLAYSSFSLLIFFAIRYFEKKQKSAFEKSLHDPLTTIYNHIGLNYFAQKKERWQNKAFTLFYLNINKFNQVNNKYGFEIGNKLLQSFARRLKEEFTEETFLARQEDDTFIIIIDQSLDQYACRQIQSRIQSLTEEKFFINTKHIKISVSIGFASAPKEGENFDKILSKANARMSYFKELSD